MRSTVIRAMLALLLSLTSLGASASLTSDLQALTTELDTLQSDLAGLSFSQDNTCTQLGTLNTSIEDYIASMEAVYAQLSAPLTLTTDDLTALDELGGLAKDMAADTERLSWELRSVEDLYDMVEYRAGLSAMLRLSQDIGTMADRILEMADRILAMADNIGTMADRILTTQQLQNSNVALTQAAILTTQENMVALSDSVSSIAYNVTLGAIVDDSETLSRDMAGLTLTEANMADELGTLTARTTALLDRVIALYTTATTNSQAASHYINGDTLTLLGDLSTIHAALAASLDTYADAVDALAPVTDNVVLADATAGMLQLTRDIGAMSDRIMEMSNRIIIMADNIGVMSDRIVDTQNIQQTNVDLTRNSLVTAQNVTVAVIANAGL